MLLLYSVSVLCRSVKCRTKCSTVEADVLRSPLISSSSPTAETSAQKHSDDIPTATSNDSVLSVCDAFRCSLIDLSLKYIDLANCVILPIVMRVISFLLVVTLLLFSLPNCGRFSYFFSLTGSAEKLQYNFIKAPTTP